MADCQRGFAQPINQSQRRWKTLLPANEEHQFFVGPASFADVIQTCYSPNKLMIFGGFFLDYTSVLAYK